MGGVGWYRKRFRAEEVRAGGQAEILFEGVYMNSDVWLNGHHLGFHPYGYTSFAYDLTPYLSRDSENVMAVRVRNVGRNSRWYSGSGIYRHVWLNVTGPIRVPLWGVDVTTPRVTARSAGVKVSVKVENHEKTPQQVTVRVRLLDSKNHLAGSHEVTQRVDAGGEAMSERTITVSSPALWSPSSPHLYRAEVELVSGGKTLDATTTLFGIRKIEADAEHGLRINGEVVKLRGGCMHHANGLLGAAAIDRAEERRVELMKEHGFNAYCGDIDLIGKEKPQFLYKKVLWGRSKLEMAVQRPIPDGRKQLVSAWGWPDTLQSWAWPGQEGKALTVHVYSQGDQVQLLLNGREIGTKAVSEETQFRAEFDVAYAPGELKAITLKQGRPIAEVAFKTAGSPAGLRLKADRRLLRPDRNDLAYVTLEVADASGNIVPDAAVPVSFEIRGAGELAATGTANPKDVRSFRHAQPSTYHGKCLTIVRPAGSAGGVTLVARSAGLHSARLTLKVS